MFKKTMTTGRGRMIVFASTLVGVMLLAGGCDCDKKAQKMEDRSDRFNAQRKACCDALAALGDNQAAAECYQELSADIARIQQLILDFEIACNAGNTEAMNNLIGLARQWESANCGEPLGNRNLAMSSGGIANLSSPLTGVEELSFNWQASNRPVFSDSMQDATRNSSSTTSASAMHNQFRGSICMSIDGSFVCGVAHGAISWGLMPSEIGQAGGSTVPVSFKVDITMLGETVSLALIDYVDNAIIFNSDGTGVMEALVSINAPSSLGIVAEEVWIELPLKRTLAGISFKASELTGLDAAPQAPHPFSDWNDDNAVTMLDYSAYMTDFADHNADVNFDGETDGEDLVRFEELFWADYEGHSNQG